MPKTGMPRPLRMTFALNERLYGRLERLAEAMGQPISVATQVAVTLGLNTLEDLYRLTDASAVSVSEQIAQAGLPALPEELPPAK